MVWVACVSYQKNNEDILLITSIYSAKETNEDKSYLSKYYAEHPDVPNFGAVIAAPPIEKSPKSNGKKGWTYTYDSKDVTEESIKEYNKFLIAAGFEAVGYDGGFITYEKKNTTVMVGVVFGNLMIAIYI